MGMDTVYSVQQPGGLNVEEQPAPAAAGTDTRIITGTASGVMAPKSTHPADHEQRVQQAAEHLKNTSAAIMHRNVRSNTQPK